MVKNKKLSFLLIVFSIFFCHLPLSANTIIQTVYIDTTVDISLDITAKDITGDIIEPSLIQNEWLYVELVVKGKSTGILLFTDDGFKKLENVLNYDPSLVNASIKIDHSKSFHSFGIFKVGEDLGMIPGDKITYGYAYSFSDFKKIVIENQVILTVKEKVLSGYPFELGISSEITEEPYEVISGQKSLVSSYYGNDLFTHYFYSNLKTLALKPNKTYNISFDYRVLVAPDLGFKTIFYSVTAGNEDNFLPGYIINGFAGDTGTVNFSKKLGNYNDYIVYWNITGTGSISIDNVVIKELETNLIVAEEDFEDEDIVLSKYEGDCFFCWVNGQKEGMPVQNNNNGFMPDNDDYREEIVLDENFTVSPNENIVLENKIIWVKPTSTKNIEIFGTLTIKDSLMLWEQTEHHQTRLVMMNGSFLNIQNSYAFSANEHWFNWDYMNGSEIVLDGFVGDAWTSIYGSVDYLSKNYSTTWITILLDVEGSNIEIVDSHNVSLELYIPHNVTKTLTLPETQQWIDWDIDNIWPNTLIKISNSYLSSTAIGLSNNTHLTIKDMSYGFSLGWLFKKDDPGFIDCELSGLGSPGNDNGILYINKKWDPKCNNSSLTIINSKLIDAWPSCMGNVHLKVDNSNLVDPRNFSAPATYEIYNSTIDHVAAYDGGQVYLENVLLKHDIEVKGDNSYIYGYNVIKSSSEEYKIIESNGGSYIELNVPGIPW